MSSLFIFFSDSLSLSLICIFLFFNVDLVLISTSFFFLLSTYSFTEAVFYLSLIPCPPINASCGSDHILYFIITALKKYQQLLPKWSILISHTWMHYQIGDLKANIKYKMKFPLPGLYCLMPTLWKQKRVRVGTELFVFTLLARIQGYSPKRRSQIYTTQRLKNGNWS